MNWIELVLKKIQQEKIKLQELHTGKVSGGMSYLTNNFIEDG